jgi:cyanophycinase
MPTKGNRTNGRAAKKVPASGASRTVKNNGAHRKARQFKNRPVRPGDPHLTPKGRLLIIGGHEDKHDGRLILRALSRLVGSGKLVIATLASEQPGEQWEEYETTMRGVGVRHLYHLKIESRADAESPAAMSILEGATGVFFTGGDQLRLTTLIGDTPVFSRCYEIFANGGVIAGTSAGASVMSETMIVSGNGSASPRIGEKLQLAPGFGFAKDMVIDQHFAERGRVGRLIGVVAQNPRILGLGIDENTAIELEPFRRFRVLGEGSVTVIDGSDVTDTNIADDVNGRAISVFGVRLHLLTQGDEFDFITRTPKRGSAEDIDDELGVESKEEENGAKEAAE